MSERDQSTHSHAAYQTSQYTLDLEPFVQMVREPYEAILDQLLEDGLISSSQRDRFRQQAQSVLDRWVGDSDLWAFPQESK